MRSHDIDFLSAACGLLFLVIGVAVAVGALDALTFGPGGVVALVLVATGVALGGAALSATRRS